jgi:exonuclease III
MFWAVGCFVFVMDISNFLIWNVRGLNDKSRQDVVKTVVASLSPSLVCLQETKLSNISSFDLLSVLGPGYSNYVFNLADGTRGGILIAWKDGVLVSSDSLVKDFSVSVLLQDSVGNHWWFSGVYGTHQDGLKSFFIDELREVRSACQGPWIVAGDFNQIFRVEDKNNPNINRSMLRRFRRLMNDLELKEIPLLGRRFTWSNERGGIPRYYVSKA